MIKPITIQRWKEAQAAERKCHTMTMEEGIAHYANAYKWNFHYCGIEEDQEQKTIIEVGPADIPALCFVKNYMAGIVVEPMESETLTRICNENDIAKAVGRFEEMLLPLVDEVWMFNLLQHVQDPEATVFKAKQIAGKIRFFEPLDCAITDYHPHSITMDDLKRWYGVIVKLYDDKQPGFHDGPCGYGVWIK